MKPTITLKNSLALMATAGIIFACSSSDDGGTPPPPSTVDCNATGPTVTATATAITGCGLDDGQISLDITGGTGNLEVTIDPQPLGVDFSNGVFSNVEPGTYTVSVNDADNCSTSENVVVDLVDGNVSYANDIDPIIQARCAISSCHDGSNATAPNYTIFTQFQARANNNPGGVRQRVKTDDMPQTGDPLTAEEKALLFCWIDEGAMNN